MRKAVVEEITERKDVPPAHTWDLSKLCPDDAEWDKSFEKFQEMLPEIEKFKGTLGKSAESLRACLQYMKELGIMAECLGYYAHLKVMENVADNTSQARFARYMQAASRMETLSSYQTPEIQAIPDKIIKEFLAAYVLGDFVIPLRKIIRFKPHILSEQEERLLALQTEANQAVERTFTVLTNADFTFGTIDTTLGKKPLSLSSFSYFMEHPDRQIRKTAYAQFYETFEKHKNALASLYEGSVQLDVYKARARNFTSSRAAAIFPDKVEETVYDVLISTVHDNLDALHRYYDIRKKALGLKELRHYDVYASLIKDVHVKHTFEEAVDLVLKSLKPLGDDYCTVLKGGLLGRWVDRYENKGKRSGAFSAGTYVGEPYILLNYKDDVIREVFTLAHEAGHSMHSWYSARHNPFQYYNYTIFEAEVASTFNEQLLADYLMKTAKSKEIRTFLTGKLVDDIIATIFRQTMFAEYEHITHKLIEDGSPLTLEVLRKEYRKLLELYFGPSMVFEESSDLEALRIPHFYHAFYVYKYATGLAAAIELSRKVLQGGADERESYLNFLKSGGSRYPLESLQLAGVDMQSPEPIIQAMKKFRGLLNDLENLLL